MLTKGSSYWKHNFCRLYVQNPASRLLQIGQKSEKWQWRHNLPTWRQRQIFLMLFCFSCFSSLVTGPSFMSISSLVLELWHFSFIRGLTRNPEIKNTTVWVFPNIWRLRWVMDTKFGTNVSNRMLLNAAKFQGYSFYHFWVIKGKPTWGKPSPPPRLRLNKFKQLIFNLI